MSNEGRQDLSTKGPLGPGRPEQRSGRGSVLVLGLAKTGTTGLYNAIKGGLRAEGSTYYHLFEPTSQDQLKSLSHYAPETRLLTKVMLSRLPKLKLDLSTFRRRILIARDPRDTLVSHLIFRAFLPYRDAQPHAHDRFLAELRRKEADSTSISLLDLHELANELGLGWLKVKRHQQFWQQLIDLDAAGEYYSITYEDFVDGRIDQLEHYLELELKMSKTPEWLQHIDRSRGYGEWRRWFTVEDVEILQPLVDPFLVAFGYERDWRLSDGLIDPSTSSVYVEKQMERQHLKNMGKYESPSTSSESQRLHELAGDGQPAAMYTLAKVYRTGNEVVEIDAERAFHWAYQAAIQGHRYAQFLLAKLYEAGEGVSRDSDRSCFWLREAAEQGVEPAQNALETRRTAPAGADVPR